MGPVIGYIRCPTGRESNLADCNMGTVGEVNCHHGRDTAVRCQCERKSLHSLYFSCSSYRQVYFHHTAPPYHEVTITTDPPEGPFPIGSTVSFQCSINPPAPEGATYSWSDSIPSTYVPSTQQLNLTITIPAHHPSQGHYYCTVSNGSSVLGVGSTTISVRSELHSYIWWSRCFSHINGLFPGFESVLW